MDEAAKGYAPLLSTGKTAVVGSGDLAFGILRMYASLAEINGHLVQYGVFKSMDEAWDWLMSEACQEN